MGKNQTYLSPEAKEIEELLEKQYGPWVKEKDLGFKYFSDKTEFNVFASGIQELFLQVFKNENSGEVQVMEQKMKNLGKNLYSATVNGDLENMMYRLKVKKRGKEHLALDPYTEITSLNGDKSLIIHSNDIEPQGWDEDSFVELKNPVDAVIYETHVQDFTQSSSSGVEKNGKYIGLVEENTTIPGTDIRTGLDHLKQLGINYVQLMPLAQNGSAIEHEDDSYNWGYDPENFMVPEGSYSERPEEPKLRVLELKEMVKKLHQNGIGVIKDTVLNHTYVFGRNSLRKLAKDHFFRNTNGSGCGNEIATENPIVQKYVMDILKHWQKNYHIDGFRLDLMALHSKKTLETVKRELEHNNPSTMFYGEPWKAQRSEIDDIHDLKSMERKNQINSGIAAFNDKARDGIKGSPNGTDRGYVTGKIMENRDLIKDVITGEVEIFKGQPYEVIAYTTCHDGNTLYEKICKSAEEFPHEKKKEAAKFANSIILTSQAIPFIHSGDEMLRTRKFDHNPYKGPKEKNMINWHKKEENIDLTQYYQGLIKLRKDHPAFRIGNAEDIRESIRFYDDKDLEYSPKGLVVYQIDYDEDEWDDITVIHNPYHEKAKVELPGDKRWKVVVDGKEAGTEQILSFKGKVFRADELSTTILHT